MKLKQKQKEQLKVAAEKKQQKQENQQDKNEERKKEQTLKEKNSGKKGKEDQQKASEEPFPDLPPSEKKEEGKYHEPQETNQKGVAEKGECGYKYPAKKIEKSQKDDEKDAQSHEGQMDGMNIKEPKDQDVSSEDLFLDPPSSKGEGGSETNKKTK